jgi:hypothetical protein
MSSYELMSYANGGMRERESRNDLQLAATLRKKKTIKQEQERWRVGKRSHAVGGRDRTKDVSRIASRSAAVHIA